MAAGGSSPKVNPLVKELLTTEGQPLELSGFVGPAEKGWIRLYSDLGLGRYVEIPEQGVLRVREDASDPEGVSTLLIQSTAELRYVTTATLRPEDAVAARSTGACAAGCGSGGTRRQSIARRQDNPDGPEGPPEGCDINCEMSRNICEYLARDGSDVLWCAMEFWLCRLACRRGGISPGGGVVVA